MKKESLIAIIVIGGLILLGIGFALGLNLGKKITEGTKVEPFADLLESKVIRVVNANVYGEVTEISGRNLTLSNEGDTLTILIGEKTTISRIVPSEEVIEVPQPAVREEIEFEEIKIGDRVNIGCELKADASLEGVEVVVLP